MSMMRRMGLAGIVLAGLGFAPQARAACVLGTLAELPVTMDGGEPTVAVSINGSKVRLVANSGAGFSIIFDRPARDLGLPDSHPGYQLDVKGLAGTQPPWLASVKRFGMAGQEIQNVDFVVAGHQATPQAIGYLGQNILGIADTEYDLANGVIRLLRDKGCGDSNLAYWVKAGPYSIMPLGYATPGAPQLVGVATINGARIRITFNTATSSSVLSLSAARRAGIKTDDPGVKPAGVVYDWINRPSSTWIAPVASFQIGDETVKNTSIRVGDVYSDADMVIGLDFFLSHRILVAKSQKKVYLTYNGGPVFDLTRRQMAPPAATPGITAINPQLSGSLAQADIPATEPKDADGYGRRAAAFEARGELDHALADFTRAVELAPGEPRYLERRATVHSRLHQPFLAMDDADAALRLKPGDVEALAFRAALRWSGNDEAGARMDANAASAAAAKDSPARLELGALYSDMGLYPQAIAQFDLLIATHDNDGELARAHNGRCWARALQDIELDKALSDCNAAVHAMPRWADALDSRGLVYLRRGELDRAVADYDAALARNPKIAWSLYGRGLLELKTGDKAKGEADLAAAVQIAPHLAERAAKLGLSP